MRKFILFLLMLFLVGNTHASTLPSTAHVYRSVAIATAIDESDYADFPDVWPTSNSDVIEIAYRRGVDRETSAGDIYNVTYTISTDTYSSPSTKIFECPDTALDATNPTYGRIGDTLLMLVSCKDVGNTDGNMYLGTRDVSAAISAWVFTSVYDPVGQTAAPWGRLTATSDPNTFFFPIHSNTAPKIRQLRTTDGGASWSVTVTMIDAGNWAEASCDYVENAGHICTVCDTDDTYVTMLTSTDGLGLVWNTPLSTGLGGATGKKLTYIYYDNDSGSLLLSYTDRSDTALYASVTKPYKAFNNMWETPRNLNTALSNEMVFYEIEDAAAYKRFLGLTGRSTSGGSIADIQYQNLKQVIHFGQIGP